MGKRLKYKESENKGSIRRERQSERQRNRQKEREIISGRSYLTARKACAVESAIRNLGLKGNSDLFVCIFDFCVC